MNDRKHLAEIAFKEGIKGGIPICLGYFPVSMAFGIMAVGGGLTVLETVMISFFNMTSAGQFAGLNIMLAAGGLFELALSQFVINLRYSLMSISLSQKLDERFRGIRRWIAAIFITDEIFATAIDREKDISWSFFMGLGIMPVIGWTSGTFAGAVLGNILPDIVTNALGLALYGMFIAVFVPKSRDDRKALIAVIIAVLISTIFYYVPWFKENISGGFSLIISAVLAAAIAALLLGDPYANEEKEG